MTRDDRVREVVARAKAGEGVVKMHAPFFIQLQPDPSIHLNFWGSPFQPIPGSGRIIAPCHTHNFGFTSHIIFGKLTNVRYSVAPSKTGKYRKYVIDNRDFDRFITFRPTDERMTILRSREEENLEGDTYEMDPREWHSTVTTQPSISLLDMWDHDELEYYVLADESKGQKFTESNRYVDPSKHDELFKQVDAMLKLAGIA